MGEYSLEPPTRDLVLHLGFDEIMGDRVVDTSPQGNDGQAALDIERETGRIGQALSSPNTYDQEVDVNTPKHDFGGADRFTVAAWVRVDDTSVGQDLLHLGSSRIVLRSDANGQLVAYFTDGTNNYTVQTAIDTREGEWIHVTATLDPSDDTLRLYVDGDIRDETSTTASVDTASDGIWSVGYRHTNTSRHLIGALDDVRVYRRALGDGEVEDLYEMGVTHEQADPLGDAWQNDGIPYQGTNIELAGALAENKSAVFRDLDGLLDGRLIERASGGFLDRLADHAGISRQVGEDDATLRARIIGTLAAGRSTGTFEDLLEAAAVIAETTEDRIFIDTEYDTQPGTVFVYYRTADLDAANLSTATISSLLEDAIPGGHRVSVVERGADPFTLTDDTTANDPSLGLTSDSISTGGGLVSDS